MRLPRFKPLPELAPGPDTAPGVDLAPPPYCRRCGYDLGGVADDGACPECGTPVSLSRRSHLLSDADPQWLRRVGRGWRVINATARLGRTAFLAFGIVSVAITTMGWMTGTRAFDPKAPLLAAGILAIVVVAASIGVAIASAPDPQLGPRESPRSARRVMRWSLAASWMFSALAVMAIVTPIGPVGRSIVHPLLWATLASFAIAALALLRWMAELADRVPAPKSAQQARRCERRGRWMAIAAIMPMLAFPLIPLGGIGSISRGMLFFMLTIPSSILLVIAGGVLGHALDRIGASIAQVHRDVAGEPSTGESGHSTG